MHANRLQYWHFFFSAFRSSVSAVRSCARALRRSSSCASNSLKPPPSPIRLVPESEPFTGTSPSFAEPHWLHSLRRAQFQLPHAGQRQSPTDLSMPGGSRSSCIPPRADGIGPLPTEDPIQPWESHCGYWDVGDDTGRVLAGGPIAGIVHGRGDWHTFYVPSRCASGTEVGEGSRPGHRVSSAWNITEYNDLMWYCQERVYINCSITPQKTQQYPS